MNMIGLGESLKPNEDFRTKVGALRLFVLSSPRGGQYNDGYQLNLYLVFESDQEQLRLLDFIGVDYQISDQKPEPPEEEQFRYNSPIPINVGNGEQWLHLKHAAHIFDHKAYLDAWPQRLRINRNHSSWYSITLDDVESLLNIETKLFD